MTTTVNRDRRRRRERSSTSQSLSLPISSSLLLVILCVVILSGGGGGDGPLLCSASESSSSSSSSSSFFSTARPRATVRDNDDVKGGVVDDSEDLREERSLLEKFFRESLFDDEDGDVYAESDDDDESSDASLFRKVVAAANEDADGNGKNRDGDESNEKEALYEAYNLLHSLAQDFKKPFDAPAVLVVGHQSSGKSALIEALMGFQFNAVGGGTKTRRPVALRMQYNPSCHTPRCFLTVDDEERLCSLAEIQAYISKENERLERASDRCFDATEINVRMEYKYCPNMILIDTPGLIGVTDGRGNLQQRTLYASSKEVERLVLQKMRCRDYVILCVEDTSDWKHGKTRDVVRKVDPDLSRTIIVNTKLDTKVPQFGSAKDVENFLRADVVDGLAPRRLGGPFFTSVPAGRVATPYHDVADDPRYADDNDFVAGCADAEERDRAAARSRLSRAGGNNAAERLLPRVGLSRLRGSLERVVDERYRRNVGRIVPLLQAEHAAAARRLKECEARLSSLSADGLRAAADAFCDDFAAALANAVRGDVAAPVSVFGETLEQESLQAGSFRDVPGCPVGVPGRAWEELVSREVGHEHHRLYGGAQYHRALREFNLAARRLRDPDVSEDEIANAAGTGDSHDGINFLRASCVIALEKARDSFDPLLDALDARMCHVMSRLFAVSEYVLRRNHDRDGVAARRRSGADVATVNNNGNHSADAEVTDLTKNPRFRQLIGSIYDRFVDKCSDEVMARCRDDITALTRFVTWDLHERNSEAALRRAMPEHTDLVGVYKVAVQAASSSTTTNGGDPDAKSDTNSDANDALVSSTADKRDRDWYLLVQFLEEAACSSRDADRTVLLVSGLVRHIVAGWRESFGRTVTTKYNCFFLTPFLEDFRRFLREELTKAYEEHEGRLGDVFDLTAARRALAERCDRLRDECEANRRLRGKFDAVATMMQRRRQRELLESSLSSLGTTDKTTTSDDGDGDAATR